MQAAGARARDDVHLAGGVAAKLGAVGAAQRLELGDGVDGRIREQREISAAVNVVGAINRPVVGCWTRPIDGKGYGVGCAGGQRVADVELVAGTAIAYARLQDEKLLVVAV